MLECKTTCISFPQVKDESKQRYHLAREETKRQDSEEDVADRGDSWHGNGGFRSSASVTEQFYQPETARRDGHHAQEVPDASEGDRRTQGRHPEEPDGDRQAEQHHSQSGEGHRRAEEGDPGAR